MSLSSEEQALFNQARQWVQDEQNSSVAFFATRVQAGTSESLRAHATAEARSSHTG